jgi:H+/Cl- antiporter ClcA
MKPSFIKMIQRYIRWSFLSVLAGLLAGFAATLFLILLQWATATRDQHPYLIWFLPFAGLVIGWSYHYYGRDVAGGNNLILEEIHHPKKVIPVRMAPLILWSTVTTHLFGGSAGREGTVVQMGGSLADQLSSFFRIEPDERKILLVAGVGAGFGAAIGAPWAGAVFGMEVIQIGKLRLFAWFECLMASFTGYFVTILFAVPHSVYPKVEKIDYELRTILIVLLFGCFCGVVALSFARFTHWVEGLIKRSIRYPPFKPMAGGFLLLFFYYLEGSYLYAGLGISVIQEALSKPSELHVPLLKGLFTALTLGSGFKGGEFVPLVFIGTTLGSALSVFFKVSTPLLATVGFSALFAGASNTPIACTIMAMELFGPEIGGYVLAASLCSYYFSGHKGIYGAQKIVTNKHRRLIALWKHLGELPNRFGARRTK